MLIRYKKWNINFSSYKILEIRGEDTFSFLQRQLTNDVELLKDNLGQLSSRLDCNGRVHSFFYLFKKNKDQYFLLIDINLFDKVYMELEKYHITEEIQFNKKEEDFYVYLNCSNLLKDSFLFSYCDLEANLSFEKLEGIETLSPGENETLILSTAWPSYGLTQKENVLINNSRLNDLGVSYSKGCFLGLETVSKIQTKRGASFYPVILKGKEKSIFKEILILEGKKIGSLIGLFSLENKKYGLYSLIRDFRIENRILDFGDSNLFEVIIIPFFKDITKEEKSKKLYLYSITQFHTGNKEEAIELLENAISLNPANADAYESKGVILGQMGEYKEAIALMDKLLEVDNNSIMAHTNKSLFFMKLGEIEKAEEEKSEAVLANFRNLALNAKSKKEAEAKGKEDEKKDEIKEQMFKKVLEIDLEDEIANFGLASILFRRKCYMESINHLKIVLSKNKNYSAAYILLGKSYELIANKKEAIEIYSKGIKIASTQGDLMPANEMQVKLNNLTISG